MRRPSRISTAAPMRPRGGVRQRGRGVVASSAPTDDARVRPRGARSTPAHRARSSPGAPARRMRCRSTPACPIRRASRTTARADSVRDALDYMGIAPGRKLTDIAIDRVFIGSCTNARIEDLARRRRGARGPDSKVPGLVVARLVQRQAAGRAGGARPHLPRGRARMGASPAARCASASMATWWRRASAAPRPPTAISAAARGRARART